MRSSAVSRLHRYLTLILCCFGRAVIMNEATLGITNLQLISIIYF